MAPQNNNYDDHSNENLAIDIAESGLIYKHDGKIVTVVRSEEDARKFAKGVGQAARGQLLKWHGPMKSDKWGYMLTEDSKYRKALEKKETKESDCGILMVGPSQHGKSTLINFILKGERVPKKDVLAEVGVGHSSCTKDCTLYTSNYNGVGRNLMSNVIKYDIIDTPGLLDSSRENEFLNALAIYDTLQELKGKTKLNCVVLVLRYGTNISDELIESLKVYQRLLGQDLFDETLCVVFSHVSYSPEALELLEEDSDNREEEILKSLHLLKSGLKLRNDPRHFALNAKPQHVKDIEVALQVRQFILDLANQSQSFENTEPRIAKTKEMMEADKVDIATIEGERRGYMTSYEDCQNEISGIKSTLSVLTEEIANKEREISEIVADYGKLAGDRDAIVTQERKKPKNVDSWRVGWPWKKAVIQVEADVEIHDFQHLNCYQDEENSTKKLNRATIVVYSRFMRTFKYSEVCVLAKKVKYYAAQIDNLRRRQFRATKQLDDLHQRRGAEVKRMGTTDSANARLRGKIESADAKLGKLRSEYLTSEDIVSKMPDERQRRRLHWKTYQCQRVNFM